ncbi:MAG TPA: hypothetical protein VFF65_11155 [Phycisphaerales bacterium]|nr:hypothetical protein [Phycisphaerales bacterium]
MTTTPTPARAGAISALDRLIRGQLTSADQVRTGEGLPLKVFLPWAVALGATYGFFVGWYALTGGKSDAVKHVLAVMVKMPVLFLFTLLVTFPSLYVFNAMLGCRLGFRATLRLLVATIVVNLAIAASLGPILGFFSLSTSSYGFMVLLNVTLLGVAGLVSIGFLIKTLVALQLHSAPPAPPTLPGYAAAPEPQRGSATGIFWVWIITYGIVGAQMGWILRPFIGAPGAPFQLFRARDGSFLSGVFNAVQQMF